MNKIVEPALTIGSGALAEVLAGLAGIAATVAEGPEQGANVVAKVKKEMTYVPRTEEGKEGLEALGNIPLVKEVGEVLSKAETALGDSTLEHTGSPVLAAAAHSVPTLLLELAGVFGSRVKHVHGQANMFLGPSAKKANLSNLKKAKEMEGTPQEVFKETGWFKDDGDWKFEISDAKAKIKNGPTELGDVKQGTLGDYLEHPELYENYPELADIPTKVHKASENFGAASSNQLEIKGKTKGDMEDIILHEVQHPIQRKEGFNRGGNPTTPEARAWTENERAKHPKQMQDYTEEMERYYEERSTSRSLGIPSKQFDMSWAKENPGFPDPLNSIPPRIKSYDDGYIRLKGEIEARQVTDDRWLSMEERLNRDPIKTRDFQGKGISYKGSNE